MDVTFFELRVENQPGVLGKVATWLQEDGINIDAFNAGREGLRVLTNDPAATRSCLDRHHVGYSEEEVIEIRLENKPGSLAEVATALGNKGVNIVTSFGAASQAEGGSIYIAVDDVDAAWDALETIAA